jgi:hypothetical protein
MDRFYAMLARFLSEHLLQTDCELELGGVGLSTWFEKFIHVFPMHNRVLFAIPATQNCRPRGGI